MCGSGSLGITQVRHWSAILRRPSSPGRQRRVDTQGRLPEQCANGKPQDRTTHDVTGVVHPVVDPAVAHGGGRSVQREREQREICRHSRDEGERRGRMA